MLKFQTSSARWLFALLACAAPLSSSAAEPPRLAVVVVVDQFGAEVFERLAPLFTGGFKTLSDSGVRFRQANHDHALTQTGPGHFVLLSGRHPGPAGVWANEFYDRIQRKIVYCADDTEARILGGGKKRGVSYRNVDATALGDWLKAANPRSHVFSVAGKDRSAVLMGGRHPDGAYWFDPSIGAFTTSTAYAETIPAALARWNAGRAGRFAGQQWNRALNDESLYRSYAGPDDAPGEGAISEFETAPVFPHAIHTASSGTDRDWYGQFASFPWLDALTLELAQQLVLSEGLGMDTAPDLLCVSLSAFDYIGHTFGPNSQEVMDAAIRIDRDLDTFLNFLNHHVGRRAVVVAFTSDHGVLPLVEWLQSRGERAARVGGEVKRFKGHLAEVIRGAHPDADRLFLFHGQENVVFNPDELVRRKIKPEDLYRLVRREASKETWIARVYDRKELLNSKKTDDVVTTRVRHSFHPDRGPDLFFIPNPHLLTRVGYAGRGTNHGTPYDYDARVPLILMDSSSNPQVVDRPVRTVDLAPTIARILGIPIPKEVDGESLPECSRRGSD